LKREPLLARRDFLKLGAAALAAPLLPGRLFAALETGTELYGISTFGELKYPQGFSHFDYASPQAPKGGKFVFTVPNWVFNQSPLTFNTLNTYVPRGDAPPRIEMCHDTLMTASLDEPDSFYGLLAESVTIAPDWNSFIFRLRPEARFHDGTPVTARDAAFTFNVLKEKGHPSLMLPLGDMTEAAAEGEHDFRVSFNGEQSPQTIFAIATYPVLSEAWFEEHPFDASQLVAPLGCGPYKVGNFSAGRFIEYDKVPDYWGRDLNVNRGLNHFDHIRVEFFRERQAGFEAFKKGDILFRQEFTARVWATEYNFPAITEKKVAKREFPSELRPSMQAWAVNQRRARFRDPRVREAIASCFDFEWTNANLFYNAYKRAQSCFEKSDFKAEGTPSPEELALLEPLRDQIPETAFGEAVMQPVSNGSGRDRNLLRRARELMIEVGWRPQGNALVNDRGEPFRLEVLVEEEALARILSPFVENMRVIGMDATIRQVDSAQYQARQADFDYDMISMAQSFTGTPTRDQLVDTFHSSAAKAGSSRNYPGTESPAVDALIDIAGRANNRDELVTAIRALDRVLRARRDWIPNWYAANHRAAFWDMFGFKEPKPDYGFPVESLWWIDEEKAKAIGKA
jgi:microcin C transport system substrate-binding protein